MSYNYGVEECVDFSTEMYPWLFLLLQQSCVFTRGQCTFSSHSKPVCAFPLTDINIPIVSGETICRCSQLYQFVRCVLNNRFSI